MRTLRLIALGLAGMVALLSLVVGTGLIYRTYRQYLNSSALAIHSPNGIDQGMYVNIGGLPQWIQIRGEDRRNPILLFVHGGPALSMIPFTYRTMRPWEAHYTIVSWDQRGAGRTYFRNGGADQTATNMYQIIDDGIEVADFARTSLHQDKVILLGESWGSAISLEMARRRPDLFYAFVGTGQAVDLRRAEVLTYGMLLQQLRTEHDEKATTQLLRLGPPPYSDPSRRAFERIEGAHPSEPEGSMGTDFLFAPGYSLHESYQLLAEATQHRARLLAEAMEYNAESRGSRFEVPVFFFQGSNDTAAPTQLAAEYLNTIRAPSKALVVIPGGGHNAFVLYSQQFLHELDTRVRPLATPLPQSAPSAARRRENGAALAGLQQPPSGILPFGAE
jgi:pimeloyl-ACP methyl ester carboxylesterase